MKHLIFLLAAAMPGLTVWAIYKIAMDSPLVQNGVVVLNGGGAW